MKIKKTQKNRAFTLIELMVATSIFVIIMLASMSSLFIMLDATKNSKALRSAMDNVNFAMESMTRSIRMGTNYYCVSTSESMPQDPDVTKNCPDGGTYIAFVPQNTNSRIGYKLTQRSDNTYTLQRCDSSGNCVDIVSTDINIERLKFFIKGSGNNDGTQASVYIIIKGTVKVKGVPTSFAIQTMASQRNF